MFTYLRDVPVVCNACQGLIEGALFVGGDHAPLFYLNLEPHTCDAHDDAEHGERFDSPTMSGIDCWLSRRGRCRLEKNPDREKLTP